MLPPYTKVDNAKWKTLLVQGVPMYDIRQPEKWRSTGVVEGSHKPTCVDASGRMNLKFVPQFIAEVGKHDLIAPRWMGEGNPVVKNERR